MAFKKPNPSRYPFWFCFAFFSILFLGASPVFSQCFEGCGTSDDCGDLQVSGGLCGETEFCEGEPVCIKHTVDPFTFDEWVIWWNDEAETCHTYPSSVTQASHIYVQDTCLGAGLNFMEPQIFIKFIKYCSPGSQAYSLSCVTTFVTIKVDPVASFGLPPELCIGEEACFLNSTCENADTATYEWFVDGELVSDAIDLCHTFTEYGEHEVCLVATNECGSHTTCTPVNVRDVPQAIAEFAYTDSMGCAPVAVFLDDQSIDADTVCWFAEPEEDATFVSSDTVESPDATVILETTGIFLITSVAKNGCGEDTTELEIETFEPPAALVLPPDEACGELLYEPDVTYSGSVDSINWFVGNGPDPVSNDSFPQIQLDVDSHLVTVEVIGRCGVDSSQVTVVVNSEDSVSIIPIEPLCSESEPIELQVNSGTDGTFECSVAVSPDGIFDPAEAVIGGNTVCFSTNSLLCPGSDTIMIEVEEGVEVDISGPSEVCIDLPPFQLFADPPGGQWLGPGVISPDGMFDPQVAGADTHALEYRYDDPAGCTTFKFMEITVVAMPLINADNASICATDTIMTLEDLTALTFSPLDGNLTCIVDGVPGCSVNPSVLDTGVFEIVFTYEIQPGCVVAESIDLTITELAVAGVPPDTTLCYGEPLILQGLPIGCGEWAPQPFISLDGVVATTSFTNAETFTYTCNEGTFCETSAQTTVTLLESPTVPQEGWACESEQFFDLPTGSPPDGTWSGDALSGNTVHLDDLEVGDHTYIYTVEDLPGECQSAEFVLHLAPLPVAGSTFPDVGCVGEAITFTNTSTGAEAFLWSFGSAADPMGSIEENPTVVYNQTGNFPVSLEVQTFTPAGLLLCSDVFTGSIYISEPPDSVSIAADATEGCAPFEVVFSNMSTGENMQYLWSFGGTNLPFEGQTPPPITFEQMEPETTFYEVTLMGWNDCDTLWDTLQITVLPQPSAGIGIQFDEPCSGGELVLNNLSTGNPANSLWTVENITLGTIDYYSDFIPPAILVFAPQTMPATVVITLETWNDCGTDVATDTVEVQPSPIEAQMSFSAEKICVGDTLFIENISTPGTQPEWLVVSNIGDSLWFGGDILAYVPTVAGEFWITLFAHGCGYDSILLAFEALTLPVVSATAEPTYPCENQAVTFEVETGGNAVAFFYGDGNWTDLALSHHAYDSAGTYQLLAIAETPLGCQGEWTGEIEIAEAPVVAITATDSICAGAEATFMGTGMGVESWEWSFCDTCYAEGSTVSYSFPATGTYPVQLVGVSPFGCRDTTGMPFYVRPTPEAMLETEVIKNCTPAELTLHDLSSLATGIEWQLSDGQNSTLNTAHFTIEGPGELEVLLIATNAGICFDTAHASLSFFQTPAIVAVLEPSCTEVEGTDVSVETEEGNFVTMTGPGFEEAGHFFPQVPSGQYLLAAVSPDGCEAEAEVFITPVQELFVWLEDYLFEIDMGEEVQFQAFGNQTGLTFSWSPAIELDDATRPDPKASPFEDTFFAVAVTNELECVKYDTALVKVNADREKGIFIPEAFTPNGDGHNDIFRIRSVNPGLAMIESFEIFDRWGGKVFEAYGCEPETSTCGWDGMLRGQKAEKGVYVWRAELEFIDGVKTKMKGTVRLIR